VYWFLCFQAIPVFRSGDDRPNNVNTTDGDSVEIYCRTHAVPQATVVWLKDGLPLNRENFIELYILFSARFY